MPTKPMRRIVPGKRQIQRFANHPNWLTGQVRIAKIAVQQQILVEKPRIARGRKIGQRNSAGLTLTDSNTQIDDKGNYFPSHRTKWLVALLKREPGGRFSVLKQLPVGYNEKTDAETRLPQIIKAFRTRRKTILINGRLPTVQAAEIVGLKTI